MTQTVLQLGRADSWAGGLHTPANSHWPPLGDIHWRTADFSLSFFFLHTIFLKGAQFVIFMIYSLTSFWILPYITLKVRPFVIKLQKKNNIISLLMEFPSSSTLIRFLFIVFIAICILSFAPTRKQGP